ncbi:MAG: SAM-dependent methyltransferase, partial [Candidatus Schekmanbacteria bacterium]|nr:SAM-dependent methyltransferase [Candidatus Schekmanbacteria bacterium]
MLDRAALLADLGKLVSTLEDDVRERGRELPEADRPLQIEYAEARHAGRTASAYEGWRDERLAQVAVAWVLGAVFVRFIEDNELIERPYLSGPGDRRDLAHDQYARYFEKSPSDTDREFLRHVFREVGALPAAAGLFAETNPLWQVGLSGDGAMVLRKFWQTIDPATG